jgi:CO dehydrogenase maturation factor
VRGIRTAGRISALADEVALPTKQRGLIVNHVPDGSLSESIALAVEATGLTLLACIPLDQDVAALDADGEPVSRIPPQSPARIAMNDLLSRMFAAQEEKC